jgi:hypothetical protein
MTYLLPELTQDRAAPIPDPTGLSPIAALFAARQVDHLMLAIEELRDGVCRWPVAEFDRNEYLYCGDATRDKTCPYCRGSMQRSPTTQRAAGGQRRRKPIGKNLSNCMRRSKSNSRPRSK